MVICTAHRDLQTNQMCPLRTFFFLPGLFPCGICGIWSAPSLLCWSLLRMCLCSNHAVQQRGISDVKGAAAIIRVLVCETGPGSPEIWQWSQESVYKIGRTPPDGWILESSKRCSIIQTTIQCKSRVYALYRCNQPQTSVDQGLAFVFPCLFFHFQISNCCLQLWLGPSLIRTPLIKIAWPLEVSVSFNKLIPEWFPYRIPSLSQVAMVLPRLAYPYVTWSEFLWIITNF